MPKKVALNFDEGVSSRVDNEGGYVPKIIDCRIRPNHAYHAFEWRFDQFPKGEILLRFFCICLKCILWKGTSFSLCGKGHATKDRIYPAYRPINGIISFGYWQGGFHKEEFAPLHERLVFSGFRLFFEGCEKALKIDEKKLTVEFETFQSRSLPQKHMEELVGDDHGILGSGEYGYFNGFQGRKYFCGIRVERSEQFESWQLLFFFFGLFFFALVLSFFFAFFGRVISAYIKVELSKSW